MTIDFGLGIPEGPPKDNYSKWLTDMEATVRLLQDDFRSLWAFDHFSINDNPHYEAWTLMSFLAAHFPTYEIGSLVIDDALIGTPDKIAAEIAKFIELGVDYFMLYIHGLHDPDVAGLITEELMPKVKGL